MRPHLSLFAARAVASRYVELGEAALERGDVTECGLVVNRLVGMEVRYGGRELFPDDDTFDRFSVLLQAYRELS